MGVQECKASIHSSSQAALVVKNPPANAREARDAGSTPGPGRSQRRKRQPTPVPLPGESHGQRSLEGCSPGVASRTWLSVHPHTRNRQKYTESIQRASSSSHFLPHLTSHLTPLSELAAFPPTESRCKSADTVKVARGSSGWRGKAGAGRSSGASASASVLPVNIQGWSPFGMTGWSPCRPRHSQESSPAPQFRNINSSVPSLLYGLTLTSLHGYWENHSFGCADLCQCSDGSAF